MGNLHGNIHVFVLSCLNLHESTKTCMFSGIFSIYCPPFLVKDIQILQMAAIQKQLCFLRNKDIAVVVIKKFR